MKEKLSRKEMIEKLREEIQKDKEKIESFRRKLDKKVKELEILELREKVELYENQLKISKEEENKQQD